MDEEKNLKPKETPKPVSLRRNVLGELKKKAIPAHRNGAYLEKPDEEEIRTREIEKEKRKEELIEVEKAYKKTKQVKFLASASELGDIKYYAQIAHQTKSEFIRMAIRDKIKIMEAQLSEEKLNNPDNIQEDRLSLEELKKIRKVLEKLELKE
ncbi:MAG: hypothetical protein ACFE8B_02280 [Candidatus Hermodarchaeota archaeon]